MARVKNFYHDELERRRAYEDDMREEEISATATQAFTPGPWKFGQDDIDCVWSENAVDDGNVVCLPPDTRLAASFERWPANARLIVAAPKLAKALQDAMDILGRAESNASGNPEWGYVGPRVAACRAVLAEALGESA